MPATAYIGIGTNIGDLEANFRKAVALLGETEAVRGLSSLYRTEAVGYREQDDFLNAVVCIETGKSPLALLAACRSVEDRMGRSHTVRWGPRIIDLDILLYADTVIDLPDLLVPHPLLHKRRFVLAPLAEIAPSVIHPVLHKTAGELLRELTDTASVVKCKGGTLTS